MLDLLELVSVSTVLSSSVLDRLISAWSFLRSLSKNRLLCRLYRRIWLTLAWRLASSILYGGFSVDQVDVVGLETVKVPLYVSEWASVLLFELCPLVVSWIGLCSWRMGWVVHCCCCCRCCCFRRWCSCCFSPRLPHRFLRRRGHHCALIALAWMFGSCRLPVRYLRRLRFLRRRCCHCRYHFGCLVVCSCS